jgi:malate synthase
MGHSTAIAGVELLGDAGEDSARILTADALAFVAELQAAWRREAPARTGAVRDDPTWRVAPAPRALLDRRVELTGSVERRALVEGLSSGAQMFVAGFEDADAVAGQANLLDAVDGAIALDDEVATLIVRPRDARRTEEWLLVGGEPISAGVLDAGLFVFHCGHRLLERGAGPYLYLGGIDSHVQARCWNDLFVLAQERLALPRGTIRATVLVESAAAAGELEEILHELRAHSAGLNAAYDGVGGLVVDRCHRRGAHAIGSVGPFERQARDGFDGTSVADPGLVPQALCVFDTALGERPNRLDRIERSGQ